jgi:hypothetical protein
MYTKVDLSGGMPFKLCERCNGAITSKQFP